MGHSTAAIMGKQSYLILACAGMFDYREIWLILEALQAFSRRMDIRKCCDLLDLRPGYSQEDLKQAYKDLAQVWHPDRFAHNPRLKEKAEDKLKQINTAYEQLDQALAERQKAQAARAARSSGVAVDPDMAERIAREAYRQTATRQAPAATVIRMQLSMMAWILGIFGGSIGLIALLAVLTQYWLLTLAIVLAIGSYFGLRWWHEQ
jgi:DnaJ domain